MRATKLFVTVAIFAVLMALMTQEVDARRKILKGRKTITRTYYTEPSLPSWAIILIVGVCELLLGGIIFIIMKKRILDRVETYAGDYSVTNQHEMPLR